MRHTFVYAFLLLFQNESQYEKLLAQIQDAIDAFVEPRSGVLFPPATHWQLASEALEQTRNLKPSAELDARHQQGLKASSDSESTSISSLGTLTTSSAA